MKNPAAVVTVPQDELDFRYRMKVVLWVTLVLPPVTGIFMLSFVGVFPFPEVVYPFMDYAFVVVAGGTLLGLGLEKRFSRDIVNLGRMPDEYAITKKRLKWLPFYYFSVLFLYFAVGLVTTLYSLSTLHGFNYPPSKYFYSILGVIPGGLITALPIFFYMTDALGKYLAPRGIQSAVAPIKLKLVVLGLFVPVLIDTLLMMYFNDRTGYFHTETVVIWFLLIIIASVGTLMAWQSFKQSMSPFESALSNSDSDHDEIAIIPQSLDEMGLLSQRWHDLWLRVLDYEKGIRDSNVALQGDVQLRTQELYSERQFIDKVLENAGALVLVLDRRGHIVRFNPACERITGFSFEQLQNQPIWQWLIPPEQLDEVRTVFAELTEEGMDSQYENDLMTKDGGRILVAWNNSTIRDEAGRVQYIVSMGIDMTERQQAQFALEQARDQAEQASKAKSEFLSHMSHELRTPMNAILGFAQLLELDGKLSESQRDSVDEIVRAGNHLMELINDVLDLTRIEAGKLELFIEQLNPADVVKDTLSLFSSIAEKRHITLNNRIENIDACLVLADRLRFKQVLINLLSNAIKYNRDGGEVNLEAIANDAHRVRIIVSDSGPGIPQALQGKLFMPFERLNIINRQTVEGAGIGLALCKRIVDLMGGTIGFSSQEGKGSSFYFELPCATSKHSEI